MPDADQAYNVRLESEKARAIIWFAVLAIIATARTTVHEGDLWNFPCNSPCIHLSLYSAPILTNWIYLWLGYGACMIAYFSQDWFRRYGQSGDAFREIMRRIGNRVFLYFYPLTVAWFAASAEGSFFLPAAIQGYYWIAVAIPLSSLVIWTIEGVIGRKIAGKGGALSEAIDLAVHLAREGFGVFGEALVSARKRFWARIRHRSSWPVTRGSGKTSARLFLLFLVAGVTALTWWIASPPVLTLVYVAIGSLYVFFFFLVFIGLLEGPSAETLVSVAPALGPASSSKVFIAYGGSKARAVGLEMADCLSASGLWPRIASSGSRWSIGLARQELIFREELTCQAVLAINAEGSFDKEKFWDEVELAKYETKPSIPIVAFLCMDGGGVIMSLRTGCHKIEFDPGRHKDKCQDVAAAIKDQISQASSSKVVAETEELPAEEIGPGDSS